MYWPKKLCASLIALMMAIPSGAMQVLAEEITEEPVDEEIVEIVEEEVVEAEEKVAEEEAVEVAEEAAEPEVIEEEAVVEEAGEEAAVTAEEEVVADEDPYANVEAGVTYEENTTFPKTDAQWQVTFTYKGEAESVALTGAFQYWTQKDMAQYAAGNQDNLAVKTPFEYVEGMVQTGYNPLGDMVTIDLKEGLSGKMTLREEGTGEVTAFETRVEITYDTETKTIRTDQAEAQYTFEKNVMEFSLDENFIYSFTKQ